jgi:crotonobetainyl-CoA:carnitine CoA-transferase CaiB-like acyl-CoA transferase
MKSSPLNGITVVEVANGTSILGLGLAAGVPGMLLRQLGATVVRTAGRADPALDGDLEWSQVWNRGKDVVRTDDAERVRAELVTADVAIVYGDEAEVEQRGFDYASLARTNPALVYCRVRPSRTGRGCVADYTLLVEASAGLFTQQFQPGGDPAVTNAHSADAGTAFIMTTGILALLYQRAASGRAGWIETSLYDGLLAVMGGLVGRPEVTASAAEVHWSTGSKYHELIFECAGGDMLQLWIGGRGMYQALCELFGDPYDADNYVHSESGELSRRADRWADSFKLESRAAWVDRLRPLGVACEPVLAEGEALREEHLRHIGLALSEPDTAGASLTFIGSPIEVTSRSNHTNPGHTRHAPDPAAGQPLAGVRVLDLSAFVAGPFAAQVLADLGADVIRVEPPQGEQMQNSVWVSACQRGKRSVALDLRSQAARPALDRLIGSADVVLQNFRLGVAERLGLDEPRVRALNPDVIYCEITGAGMTGPRAPLPAADALMQAVSGLKRAMSGVGNRPVGARWVPIDIADGWCTAAGILAALYARRITGAGQAVATTLLGAAMLLQSGIFYRDEDLVGGPVLDSGRTGFGPGYRLYQTAGGEWIAVVIPDPAAWDRLRGWPECAELPADYAPLRLGSARYTAQAAESVLAAAFITAPAGAWLGRLAAAGIPAERVLLATPDDFRRGVLDDPVNQQLGRVTTTQTPNWGQVEQIGRLLRFGPANPRRTSLQIPRRGADTVAILSELGASAGNLAELLAAGALLQAATEQLPTHGA